MDDQTTAHPDVDIEAGSPNIIAIGASAGGLEALKEFFAAVEPALGFAYVVVTHMQRDHVSHMSELLSRAGPLAATEAVDGDDIQGNRIYVIPPAASISVDAGKLVVSPVEKRPLMPKPIDYFMESLAADAGPRAAGIVLSGTNHDGSIGLRAIKAAGGLTLVQKPASAQYPGMPNSAIEAGVADLVLEPRRMPEALRDYFHSAKELRARRPARRYG